MLGISRALAGRNGVEFDVVVGDYVRFCGGSVGRITGLYISYVCKGTAASVRRLTKSTDLLDPAEPISEGCTGGESLWETNTVEDHVAVATIESLCHVLEMEPGGSRAPVGAFFLRGIYAGGRFLHPWRFPIVKSEARQHNTRHNVEKLPVANLGLVVWADGFQTFNRRTHSTTTLAVTFSNLPYRLRMSGPWIRVLSCFPPRVDEMELFHIVFWPLLEMERGQVVSAATSNKRAFVKVGVQAGLSDSPFQGVMAYCSAAAVAKYNCHICYLPSSRNWDCDKVGSASENVRQ